MDMRYTCPISPGYVTAFKEDDVSPFIALGIEDQIKIGDKDFLPVLSSLQKVNTHLLLLLPCTHSYSFIPPPSLSPFTTIKLQTYRE